MQYKRLISTTEAAKILGISRIAVFKKIKKGQIKAQKIGRNYAIERHQLVRSQYTPLSKKSKSMLDKAVKKTVREYGKTLKLLGNA